MIRRAAKSGRHYPMTDANDTWLSTPIARHIWSTRYRRRTADGRPEADIEASWQRVAGAVAAVEARDRARWAERFVGILRGFRFLPGGRILAGAGSELRTTLFNCFVMGLVHDDLSDIFEALKEGALTMQAGGGIGYDFSTLRPRGSAARASGRIASGPVSFLHIWDAMCATMLSTGARRGAMLASLRCDHPDVLEFIDAKRQPGALRHFNLSVQISDAFMHAVDADAPWPLVFPDDALSTEEEGGHVTGSWPGYLGETRCRVLATVPSRMLWERLAKASYETAEPGVLFIDRINQWNNLAYREHISTTNPCGEIPLPAYGACNLGSINLAQFVREPFTRDARLDLEGIGTTAAVATRFLDNVIDCSAFPLQAHADQARGSRRIGLGLTGLADALVMLGLHYGDVEARRVAARAMSTICQAAYRCSADLAREKGSFPFFERDAYLQSRFIRALPKALQERIARDGIRNSHLTAIAPAGTISLLANNVSSGLEPVFDFRPTRQVLNREGEREPFELEDFALTCWQALGHDPSALPRAFVSAPELDPTDHLEMQAALQPHVDSAISKTVNVPPDYPFDAFRDLYQLAFRRGLKGCTTFRPNPVTGSVLAGSARQTAGQPPTHDVHCCNIEREGG